MMRGSDQVGVNDVRPQFEPVIMPLVGADLLERPSPGKPGPVPGLYHCASGAANRLLIYVPCGVSSAPLAGHCDYNSFAKQLDAIGCSLLVIQPLAAQRPAFIRFSTCLNDVAAAVAWGKQQGFTRITLSGSGLGATRAAWWAANQPGDGAGEAASLVLISAFDSPYLALTRSGSAEQKEARDRLLNDCRKLVAAGRHQEVVEVRDDAAFPGGRRAMSAQTVLDYFGAPQEASTTLVDFADRIRLPVCLIHGDEDAIATVATAAAVYDSLKSAVRKQRVCVPGGGHQLLSSATSIKPTLKAMTDWLVEV